MNQPICIGIGRHRARISGSESKWIRIVWNRMELVGIRMELVKIGRFRSIPTQQLPNYSKFCSIFMILQCKIWLIDSDFELLLDPIGLLIWHHKLMVSNLISLLMFRGYINYSQDQENPIFTLTKNYKYFLSLPTKWMGLRIFQGYGLQSRRDS